MISEPVLHVTVAFLCTIVVVLALGWGHKRGRFRVTPGRIGLGLMLLGAYFFPLGAVEAYDTTRLAFDLSESMNSVLWYAVSTGFIVVGAFLMGAVWGRR